MCEIAESLDRHKDEIITNLQEALKPLRFDSSYVKVWHDWELAVKELLPPILKKYIPCLSDENFQFGITGEEKNNLADIGVRCDESNTALSIKAARKRGSPQNDLGSLRSYEERKLLFNASFDVWVKYDDSDPKAVKSERVFFDRSYKFIGKRRDIDGVAYRKGDGRMRPKGWRMFNSEKSYWNSIEELEAGIRESNPYRANDIVREHLPYLKEADQRELYQILKQKFESEKAE